MVRQYVLTEQKRKLILTQQFKRNFDNTTKQELRKSRHSRLEPMDIICRKCEKSLQVGEAIVSRRAKSSNAGTTRVVHYHRACAEAVNII